MKKIFIVMVLLAAFSFPVQANFQDGFSAYQKNDFTTAFKAFQKAADQGDIDAQYNLG